MDGLVWKFENQNYFELNSDSYIEFSTTVIEFSIIVNDILEKPDVRQEQTEIIGENCLNPYSCRPLY